MKKLNLKTRKSEGQNQEAEGQNEAPKKEHSVLVTLLINGVKALVLLVVTIFLLNIILGIVTRHGSNRDVPELVGYSVEQAEQMLKKERLDLIVSDTLFVPIYESGVVLEQRPSAGEGKVKAGRKIYVTINADHQRSVVVPYVAEMPLRQAVSNLVAAGLEVEKLTFKNDIAHKIVLIEKVGEMSIDEESNFSAFMGSGVTLIVGQNSSSENVPNIVGKTLHEAKHMLWSAGFNLGEVRYDGEMSLLEKTDAVVYKQSPAAGTASSLGRNVTLDMTLTLDSK